MCIYKNKNYTVHTKISKMSTYMELKKNITNFLAKNVKKTLLENIQRALTRRV